MDRGPRGAPVFAVWNTLVRAFDNENKCVIFDAKYRDFVKFVF